jgi:hypothetical protein
MKKKSKTIIREFLANQINYYGKTIDAFIIGTSYMIRTGKQRTGQKRKDTLVLKLRPGKVL